MLSFYTVALGRPYTNDADEPTRTPINGQMTSSTFSLSDREESRFNDLMEATYRKVYNMAYRLSGNRSDAEDLTQEAYFRAYRSFQDFEGDRPFENWIFRIVTRLFLDLVRSRRRRVKAVSFDNPVPHGGSDDQLSFDMPDRSATPEELLIQGSFNEELQKALSTLSPEQRLLVTLADIEGVPYQEIADLMGKPVGTIRSRLHRTHKQLRARLEQARQQATATTAMPKQGLRFAAGM
jgi:RNA polymerase sigma-70 factor, ECF subfamily